MFYLGLILILIKVKQEEGLSHLNYPYYWQFLCLILKLVFFDLINFLKNLSKLCLKIFEMKGNSLMSWRQFLKFFTDQFLYSQKIYDLFLHQKPNYFDSSLIINYYNFNPLKNTQHCYATFKLCFQNIFKFKNMGYLLSVDYLNSYLIFISNQLSLTL